MNTLTKTEPRLSSLIDEIKETQVTMRKQGALIASMLNGFLDQNKAAFDGYLKQLTFIETQHQATYDNLSNKMKESKKGNALANALSHLANAIHYVTCVKEVMDDLRLGEEQLYIETLGNATEAIEQASKTIE